MQFVSIATPLICLSISKTKKERQKITTRHKPVSKQPALASTQIVKRFNSARRSPQAMSRFTRVQLLFIFLFTCASIVLSHNNQVRQHRSKRATETFYPCETRNLILTREAGSVRAGHNAWQGSLDLAGYNFFDKIDLHLKVDEAARIEVNDEDGKVEGPHSGKSFWITYYGSGQNVSKINFELTGTDDEVLPNLVTVRLNKKNICRNFEQVSLWRFQKLC